MTVTNAVSNSNFPVNGYELTFEVTACEPDLYFTSPLNDMNFTWNGSAATQTISVSDRNNCGFKIIYALKKSNDLVTISGSEISVSTDYASEMCQTNNDIVVTATVYNDCKYKTWISNEVYDTLNIYTAPLLTWPNFDSELTYEFGEKVTV